MQLLISSTALYVLILVSLSMVALGLVTLVALLIRDFRNRSVW